MVTVLGDTKTDLIRFFVHLGGVSTEGGAVYPLSPPSERKPQVIRLNSLLPKTSKTQTLEPVGIRGTLLRARVSRARHRPRDVHRLNPDWLEPGPLSGP